MHGIEQDVPFNFADAEALQSACTGAATQIQFQLGSRASWVHTAMEDFRGYFSQLFSSNATTAHNDANELITALTATATAVGKLITDAKAEQKRRDDARAWKEKHDHRGFGGWLDDTFGDGDDCPIPEAAQQMSYNPPAPSPGQRQTPAVGAYGGGGGTSSAKPENLHTFANGSRGANSELSGKPGALKTKYAAFQSSCTWGSLSAAGVFSGFDSWLTANQNDVTWAKTVGDAFAKAGSEGTVSTLPNSAIDAALKAAGVNEARTDLTIAMPSALGSPPTTGYANDPVNTSTGNFIETEVDLEFTDAAADLWWRRSYNSVHDHASAFGPGWSSWCDAGLGFSDEAASFTMPDGRQVSFPRLGAGWDRATGENLWLTREHDDTGETLVVSGNDGTRWTHTPSGRLTSYVAGEGRAVTLTWHDDRLVGLAHRRGRSIELVWDGGLVVAAVASDGRRFDYDYADGRLVSATGPLGTRRYVWDEQGLIAQVVDADGVVEVDNAYDEHGRVVAQRSPFGRTTRFAYLPGRVTVVCDEDGTRANTWIADAQGRLVGVIDAADARQSMAYDEHGNKVLSTDRDGSVAISEYDERGRRVREVVPDGADITYAYDEADRVTRVEITGGDPLVDGDGDAGSQTAVTTLDYVDDQRSPSVITDPEGGVTRMEWSDGLLTRVTDPEGVVVEMGYDAHGELVATTDASGNVARLERDDTGRVVAAMTPSGARTSYSYDETSGLLASRTDPDGASWTYEHSAAGRRTVLVDPLGARTEMEYGEHGEESASIDALGRAVRRVYDDLGYVSGAELPDGSRWAFTHDALGRLVRSVDPAGGVRETDYDVTGAPAATVDPTGVRRELHDAQNGSTLEVVDALASTRLDLDTLGRLVSETGPDGTTRLTRYDRCGRPVEVVDPVGGLTRLLRDAAGRVRTMVTPSGSEVAYTYDACGRLSTVTDQTGATSTRVYDADGRCVEQHLPTGEVATTRFDECGRVVAVRVPGVGTTTYAYDAAGRVVETRDSRNGRRRFGYDAAGQLVTASDANGGVTGYGYDANGRCTEISHPDGGVTRRAYDANNHVVAETDPLGRTTTATYDAAGRQVSQTDPTGSTTEWRHDEQGRLASTWVDGVEQSTIEHDPARRVVRVIDRTGLSGPAGEVTVHELGYDARGLLVARTRDGRGVSWGYDADGSCTSTTMPDGIRTDYARDAAGRLVGVSHPLLGTAVVERDPAGRMTSATAGATTQRWTYDDGFVVAHEVTGGGTDGVTGGSRTDVERDDDGRIVGIATAEQSTTYTYDDACQLVAAATVSPRRTETVHWRYDAAGRLVAETLDADGRRVGRELVYDLAGQLSATRVHGEDVVTYSYDRVGRRRREEYSDRTARDYAWSATGWLAAITTTDRLGDTRRTDVVVDALGELARVGDAEVFTDTANPWNGLLAVGGEQVVRGGPFTGTTRGGAAQWSSPGWRDARSTGPDPWALPSGAVPQPTAHGTGAGVALSPTGELSVAGLEWMGNRVYDPSTRGFLSVDPLEPTTGAGWAGNPYAYAGNDPLHALDPLGLHPVTDAELKAYNAHNGGLMDTAAGKWLKNNWEYVAGGAMVLAGGVLMATGVGGPAGMMLISAGADTIIQKATTGKVNWGEVIVSGVAGGIGGAGVAAKAGLTGIKAAVVTGAVSGGGGGALTGAYSYVSGPGPHTVTGLLTATGEGAGEGALLGGAGGGAGHAIGGRIMGALTDNPGAGTMAMGRDMANRVTPYAEQHGYGYYKALPKPVFNTGERLLGHDLNEKANVWVNKKWINYQMQEGKNLVDIGAPDAWGPNPDPGPYYGMEQQQVAGYPHYSQDHQPAAKIP